MLNRNNIKVHSLGDLNALKASVEVRVKESEKDLAERLQVLPREAVKATVGSFIPVFLNNRVAGSTWQIVRSVIGLLFGLKLMKGNPIKDNLYSSAKKLGFFTLLKTVYGALQKKKEKDQPAAQAAD